GDKQNVDTNPSVREIITNQVEKYDLPAMGIIVVDKNSTIYNESIGVKTYTSQEPVTHQELWGIGSITKSMSATLVATLVDQGVIGWNTTLLEVFPEFEEDMQEKYKSVTLIELLSHTSGLPADDDSTWEDFIDLQESVVDQRYAFSYEALAYTSDGVVGEYNYSNINYVITASILEKLTNTNYEMLMQAYLFDPLQMDSAQIDIENLQNNVWGHKIVQDGWEPVDPQTISADNVAIVSPAGSRTYASLDDMAKYLQFHLRTKMGENTTVFNTTNAQMLYTPVVSLSANMGYALGWFTEAPNTIQHSGSNGRWLALTVVDARSGYAYFVVTNGYKEGIEQAVFETMDLLIAKTKNS
ncbi:MAG TPA: class A beta-lactamase-related serine hydrolase, partial [Epsilonproteobacteria bacterium]|nr:class A beta-lactamase-related serine hydrolase [Campylobacterota bacterium]